MLLKRRIKIDLGKAFIHDNQSQTPVTDLFNIQCLSPAEELPTRCHCSCTQPGSQPTRTESTTSLFLLLDFLNSFLKNVQLNWAKSKVTSNPENKDLEQSLIFFSLWEGCRLLWVWLCFIVPQKEMVESSYKHIVVVCGFLLLAIHTQMLTGDFVFAEAVPFQNRPFDPCSITPN